MGKGSGSGKGAIVGDSQHTLDSSYSSLQTKQQPAAVPPTHVSPKGLLNVGNTCYANAAIQCLLSTSLSHALLEPDTLTILRGYASNSNLLAMGSGSVDEEEENNDDSRRREKLSRRERRRKKREEKKMHEKSEWLTCELTRITREYAMPEPDQPSPWFYGPQAPIVDPGTITRNPDRLSKCLRPFQQEDAHEFMRALLSTLTMNGHNKQLSSLFDGLLESAVTCQVCMRASLTRDRYMDLSLDIVSKEVNTLEDALCEFTKTELLDCDNKVQCHTCKLKQPVAKGLRLATAPSILVCQLKRFAYDDFGRLVRLSKHVRFPLHLEIGDYMSRVNKAKPPPYELVAVLVHQGRSCDSGHYLAYVKSNKDWYKVNDSVVSRVDVETVLRQQAYILMYEVAGMKSSTLPKVRPVVQNSWKDEDIPNAPRFRGSAAPEPNNLQRSLLNMICNVSEANEAIVRDFCCGATTMLNRPQGRSHYNQHERKKATFEERPFYEIAVPDSQNRTSRRRLRDFDCDDTVGNSTLGDGSTVYTTDSSQLSGLRRSNSGGNLRDLEIEAYKAYSGHHYTESDPGGKERSQSVRTTRRRHYRKSTSASPTLPPRPAGHRRRHSSTQKLIV